MGHQGLKLHFGLTETDCFSQNLVLLNPVMSVLTSARSVQAMTIPYVTPTAVEGSLSDNSWLDPLCSFPWESSENLDGSRHLQLSSEESARTGRVGR